MWYSLSDRFTLVKSDGKTNPRKIKSDIFLCTIFLVCYPICLFDWGSVLPMIPIENIPTIKVVAILACVVVSVLTAIVKFFKNEHEIDLFAALIVPLCAIVLL